MISYKRILHSCILTAIIVTLGSVIDGFVDMGWEDAFMSWYFISPVFLISYIVEPLIAPYFNNKK